MAKKNENSVVTKSQLIDELKDRFDLPQQVVHMSVKHVLDMISAALCDGRRTEIRGWGTFSVRKRKARMVRSPRTNESVYVAGKNVAHFKPGKKLRTLVNRGRAPDARH